MIYIKLNSFETVKKLCNVCEYYKDYFDINISYENYMVDGCSIVGLMELIGKEVKIEPNSSNNEIENNFYKEIEEISGYESEVT